MFFVVICVDLFSSCVSGTGFADICVGLCNPTVFYNDPNYTIGVVMCTFDAVVENNQTTWPRLEWLFECMCDFFCWACNLFLYNKYSTNLYI